jgi:hypothetical protein
VNQALHALWRPLRRALYFTHRWLGIAGCILFVLWFVSGLVMLHVRFPALTQEERIAGLPVLDLAQVQVPPAEALAQLELGNARRVVLEQSLDMPVWRVIDTKGNHHVVSASACRGHRARIRPCGDCALPGNQCRRPVDPAQRQQLRQGTATAPHRH